jgi:hypothetical protein
MKPYNPQPMDTSHVPLPPDIVELQERLAENAHEVWAQQRIAQGWTHGPQRDDAAKKHPCLVAYDDLPESEKRLRPQKCDRDAQAHPRLRLQHRERAGGQRRINGSRVDPGCFVDATVPLECGSI